MRVFRVALESLGAALLLLNFCFLLALPNNLALYHLPFPATGVVGGYLLDLVLAALTVFVLLTVVERLTPLPRRLLLGLFVGLLLWRAADTAVSLWNTFQAYNLLHVLLFWDAWRRRVCLLSVMFFVLLALWSSRRAEVGVRAVRFLLAAVAFCALWIVPHLLWIVWSQTTATEASGLVPMVPTAARPAQRIVWILFDELSQDQVLDHPAADLQLPYFNQFRASSVSFGNIRPEGFYTERILPALFLGKPIHRIRATVRGNLWYMDESRREWMPYRADETLFGLARRYGWNPGVDGSFNPYCRILAGTLSACSWHSEDIDPLEKFGVSAQKSPWANATVLPVAAFRWVTGNREAGAGKQQRDMEGIMNDAAALIADSRIHMVFIHLPVPHPPGIYNRARRAYGGGSYLDNLVLADHTLGTLLSQIERTPEAGRTTILVSSDHSWRVPIWRQAKGWLPEEEKATGGGKFDDRPVLMVRFPGQGMSQRIEMPVPQLWEHHLIAAMLRGQVESAEQLRALLRDSR